MKKILLIILILSSIILTGCQEEVYFVKLSNIENKCMIQGEENQTLIECIKCSKDYYSRCEWGTALDLKEKCFC